MIGETRRPTRRSDRALAVLLALCLANGLFFACHLVYPDLNLGYPFLGGDGPEWISTGLALTGADVRFMARPPLLPLLLGGLDRLGLLPLFPVANQVVFHTGVVVLFLLLRRRYSPRVSLAASLFALFNASAQLLALNVMADTLAAVLLFASAALFLAAAERPGLYPAAGLLGGLSATAQATALLLPLPALATLLAFRRGHLRDRRLLAGAALGFAGPAAWFVARRLLFCPHGDLYGGKQWALVALHLDSTGFYAGAALSFLGWPALVLAAIGAWRLCRGAPPPARGESFTGSEWGLFVCALIGVVIAFFALAYQFPAKRFLLYALLPAGILVAEALTSLEGRKVFWPVALTALVGSALPAPAGGAEETRFLLWPLPAVYGELPTAAGTGAVVSPLTVHTAPLAEVWAATAYGRVLAAWPRRGAVEPIDPHLFAGDGSAVFLYDDLATAADRYRTLSRLGNALRKRVEYVPRSLYPPDWWGFAGLSFVARRDEYALFQLAVPEVGESAVLALARDDPRVEELRSGALAPAPPPPGDEVARAIAREHGLEHWLEGPNGMLAVFAERGEQPEWLRLLPFVVHTSNLFVLPEGERSQLLAAFAAGPVLASGEVEDLAVLRTVYLGWRVVVVLPPE